MQKIMHQKNDLIHTVAVPSNTILSDDVLHDVRKAFCYQTGRNPKELFP